KSDRWWRARKQCGSYAIPPGSSASLPRRLRNARGEPPPASCFMRFGIGDISRAANCRRTRLPRLVSRVSAGEAPAQSLAGAERHDREVAVADLLRHRPGLATEHDARFACRHPIEHGAVQRGEGFQSVKRAFLLEHLSIEFEGRRGGKNPGTTAGGLLGR